MSEPYLGEIRMFAGNYAPEGWALCNGQLLNIVDNDALYTLLGTTYGGDGVNNFGLPDLQGRIPIHSSASYLLGAKGGSEDATLVLNELPLHTHVPNATTVLGNQNSPANAGWAETVINNYSTDTPSVAMSLAALSAQGGNLPHENMMPTLTITFIIALQGVYPNQG